MAHQQAPLRQKILTDADTGADDALSILLACAHGDVLAIGCTDGNVPSAVATDNTLRLLEAAGYTGVRVAQGLTWPDSEGRHWGRAFDDAFPEVPTQIAALPAPSPEVLVDAALQQPPESVTLVCTGPLENIGAALAHAEGMGQLQPFVRSVRRVVIMGGLCNPGSYNGQLPHNAEFNIRACVEGSRAVWSAPWPETVEFYLVPIDPIARSPLSHQDAEKVKALATAGSRRAQAAWAVLDLHVRSDECQAVQGGFEIYDAFAMALALDPAAIGAKLVPAMVTLHHTGQTVATALASDDDDAGIGGTDDRTVAEATCKSYTPAEFVPVAPAPAVDAASWAVARKMTILEDINMAAFTDMFLAAL